LKSTPIVLKKFSLKEFSYNILFLENNTYGISNQKTTFAHTTVANQEHFEKIVTKENENRIRNLLTDLVP
jgi:hypothetical protein